METTATTLKATIKASSSSPQRQASVFSLPDKAQVFLEAIQTAINRSLELRNQHGKSWTHTETTRHFGASFTGRMFQHEEINRTHYRKPKKPAFFERSLLRAIDRTIRHLRRERDNPTNNSLGPHGKQEITDFVEKLIALGNHVNNRENYKTRQEDGRQRSWSMSSDGSVGSNKSDPSYSAVLSRRA